MNLIKPSLRMETNLITLHSPFIASTIVLFERTYLSHKVIYAMLTGTVRIAKITFCLSSGKCFFGHQEK